MAQDLPDNMEFSEKFTDRAWQDMKELLDKEMPVEVPERKCRGGWVWLLLLLWFSMGIGFVCVLKDSYYSKYDETTINEGISENNSSPMINPTAQVDDSSPAELLDGIAERKQAQIIDNQRDKSNEVPAVSENSTLNTLPTTTNAATATAENSASNQGINPPTLTEKAATNTPENASTNTPNTPIVPIKDANSNSATALKNSETPTDYNEASTVITKPEIVTNTPEKTSPPPIEEMTLPEAPARTAPPVITTPITPPVQEEVQPTPSIILENQTKIKEEIAQVTTEETINVIEVEEQKNAAKALAFSTPVELITDKMIAVLPEQAPVLDQDIEVKKERSVLPNYWTLSGGTRFYNLGAPNGFTAGVNGYYRLGKSKFLLGTGLHATYLNEPITTLQGIELDGQFPMAGGNIELGVFDDEADLLAYSAGELLYLQQKSIYAEVPILLNWAVSKHFQVHAGINTSVLMFSNPLNFGVISSSNEIRNANRYTNNVNVTSTMSLLRRMDLTPMLGLSFLPTPRLGIDVRYQHGIIDLSNAVMGAQVNSNVQLGMSYWFGK